MFSPALPELTDFNDLAFRQEDLLVIAVPMHSDGEGHAGSLFDAGTTTLYREGEPIAQSAVGNGGSFTVPPEPATYRVEIDNRQSVIELTPHQTVAWTFASGHAAPGAPARLPLLVVRFSPELSESGLAPGGAAFALPVAVDQYGRESPPEITELGVEVSYDDGATWSRAPVDSDGARWTARLEHPSAARHVSLRASAQDDRGNRVEQTLLRAYALGAGP